LIKKNHIEQFLNNLCLVGFAVWPSFAWCKHPSDSRCYMKPSYRLPLLAIMANVKIVNKSPHQLPEYQTTGSAGMDLRAWLEAPVVLQPMERKLIPTGLYMALPEGYEAQIRPRSGLAIKRGLSMVNTPGTIDADYRGEIMVAMINLSTEPQEIQDGERIAQMIIAKYEQISWEPTDTLDETVRGAGGFGHSGVK